MSEESDEKQLLVVSWKRRPFWIRLLIIDTKEEIYAEAKARRDCTYKCEKERFIRCVENCHESDTDEIFTDKYHGLLVCHPSKFKSLKEAEAYITTKYSEQFSDQF